MTAHPTTPSPRAVLFDVDGTLVDSSFVHTTAWWQALRQHGHLVPMARIHRAIGLGADHMVGHLLGEHDTDEDAAIIASHGALVAAWHERLVPLPGARDLVRRCHDAGLVVVLSTSAGAQDVAALRAVLDVDPLVDVVTSSADAERSKPDPGILEAAVDRTGVPAEESLFVGDAVWDVEAAGRVGMPCLGLECGGTSAAELREAGAVATWADPQDLLEHWDDSPLAG
ncbi:HAD family hydrolase [Phycicoccus sp. CSK15P-2]|uniref:HAD family hydrolase n=1 Tax=Phycicoccus sp. CSK15P-2 TaxID=2807627 RepID=UPI00194EBAB9|nr:HAD family hydrolase [Phycicoccus sp. CSK15P-2]MBM6406083.1 HAD family hydrolase [Phycicoccus sp. CSK15P-2]